MENIWEKKYLKYKLKYINLKNLIGAAKYDSKIDPNTSQQINSIIVTHNGRLRCLMDLLGYENVSKNKFKNCAILKIVIDGTECEYSVDLIYSGELASGPIKQNGGGKSDKYYVTEKEIPNEKEIKFECKTGNIDKLKLTKDDVGNNTFVFYIIRHGDGEHNKAKEERHKVWSTLFTNKILDAKLTPNGIDQAKRAGESLKIQLNRDEIDYLFTSDLIRTRQTLESVINQGIILSKPESKVIILPCSHELDYNPEGCDGNKSVVSVENSVSCKLEKDNKEYYCSKIKYGDGGSIISLDWDFYKLFYNYKQKAYMSSSKDRFKCRNTSMLSMALFIIKNPNTTSRDDMDQWIKNHQ